MVDSTPPCSLAGHNPDPVIAAALRRRLRDLAANLFSMLGCSAGIRLKLPHQKSHPGIVDKALMIYADMFDF